MYIVICFTGLNFLHPQMNRKLIDKLFALIIITPFLFFYLCNVNGIMASNDADGMLLSLLASSIGLIVSSLIFFSFFVLK